MPDVREQVYGIKHASQVYQRGQDEGGDDGDVVEVVCKHAVEKTAEGKQDGGQDNDADDDKRTVNRRQADEEHGDDRHDQTYDQSPEHPAGNITGQDYPVWYGRNQHLLDVALKARPEERRGHIGISIVDDRHHDDPRSNELHVGKSAHHTDARTDQVAENDEVQGHADRRGQNRLRPDTHEARDLLGNDSPVGDEQALRRHVDPHVPGRCRPAGG